MCHSCPSSERERPCDRSAKTSEHDVSLLFCVLFILPPSATVSGATAVTMMTGASPDMDGNNQVPQIYTHFPLHGTTSGPPSARDASDSNPTSATLDAWGPTQGTVPGSGNPFACAMTGTLPGAGHTQ